MMLQNYCELRFNKYVSNIKQTWTTINKLHKIENKEDIANNLNYLFQNIVPTLSANIPQQKKHNFKTFLKW